MSGTLLFIGLCLLVVVFVFLVVWFANAMYRLGYRRGWRERGEAEIHIVREDHGKLS